MKVKQQEKLNNLLCIWSYIMQTIMVLKIEKTITK